MSNDKLHIRDLRSQPWLWLHHAIIDQWLPRIGPTTFAVYAVLCRHANAEQQCWPTQQHLADLVGIGRDTVSKHLEWLRQAGLIDIIKRRNSKGQAEPTLYVLLDPPDPDATPEHQATNLESDEPCRIFQHGIPSHVVLPTQPCCTSDPAMSYVQPDSGERTLIVIEKEPPPQKEEAVVVVNQDTKMLIDQWQAGWPAALPASNDAEVASQLIARLGLETAQIALSRIISALGGRQGWPECRSLAGATGRFLEGIVEKMENETRRKRKQKEQSESESLQIQAQVKRNAYLEQLWIDLSQERRDEIEAQVRAQRPGMPSAWVHRLCLDVLSDS